MSITLESIPQVLSLQFKDLIKAVYTQSQKNVIVPYSHSSKIFLIDGFAGSVIVNMQRVTQEPPKDTPFFKGSVGLHIAEVIIDPENEQIAQVMEAHFKSQIIPAKEQTLSRRLFDKIIINGKEI